MAAQPSRHHLNIQDDSLYYEVRGSGPLLLVIGQPMTSGAFAPLADLLADRHTVVTYDPHGLGQSTVADPSLPVTPEVQAEDLSHLVDAIGGGPADLFATSGGAVAGLAFAAAHPDQVRTLIAHEPPVTELLPDAPQVRAAVDDIEEAYRAAGSGAAWAKFVSLVVHNGPIPQTGVPAVSWPPAEAAPATDTDTDSDSDQVPAEPSEKAQADDELFFLRMLKPFTRYVPAVESLNAGRPQVLIAVGATSNEAVAPRSAVALAERLGTPPTIFPGDHAGFLADPAGFADTIGQVLSHRLA